MKIGAYQFAVTGDISSNLSHMLDAVSRASREGVELLVFPECAVTGYPPLALPAPADIDEVRRDEALAALQESAVQNRIYIIAGIVIRRGSSFYNAALSFSPDGTVSEYDKRALWGWDREHFVPGTRDGILQTGSLKIGIRICFEVRFPEYFRELYRAKTDLNVILFSDTAARADPDRYDLIRAHVRTRAVENVCPVLTVNNAASFQTAPTALFDASGKTLCELEPGKEGLLIYSFEKKEFSFGELGRKTLSDSFV